MAVGREAAPGMARPQLCSRSIRVRAEADFRWLHNGITPVQSTRDKELSFVFPKDMIV
ncbi:hypothetical protein BRAS3809_2430020 [Bradyrhizobium sp. STM 3809]|nr:hypothetical protein BRAS3809_2430020 [Bradyrhizobium sp. STM 3809]